MVLLLTTVYTNTRIEARDHTRSSLGLLQVPCFGDIFVVPIRCRWLVSWTFLAPRKLGATHNSSGSRRE